MALIKYSALVSDMRNKLNGSVASKNRAGNYLRNKTTPVNRQTAKQQNVRGLFGNLSSQWRDLQESQRKAWAAAAPDFPYTNIFGDIKELSGFGLFMKLNQNLVLLGAPFLANPPAPIAIPTFNITVYMPTVSDGIKITVTPASAPAGFAFIVYATPNVSPGKTFVKNEYRYMGSFIPTAGVLDITAKWGESFGAPVEGQKIGVRVALIALNSGQLGTPVEALEIVQAGA